MDSSARADLAASLGRNDISPDVLRVLAGASNLLTTSILCFSLTSCTSTRTLTFKDLVADNSATIDVILHNQDTIRYEGGRYRVVVTGDSSHLEGIGPAEGGTAVSDPPDRRRLRTRDIQTIQTETSTYDQYVAPVLVVALAATLLIVAATFDWN